MRRSELHLSTSTFLLQGKRFARGNTYYDSLENGLEGLLQSQQENRHFHYYISGLENLSFENMV